MQIHPRVLDLLLALLHHRGVVPVQPVHPRPLVGGRCLRVEPEDGIDFPLSILQAGVELEGSKLLIC